MKIYLRSIASISPAIGGVGVAGNRLNAIEPDYSTYIDARSIRRMSRIVKMGVAAALQCLQEAGVKTPDAIVTGTAYGCLADTGIFLSQLIRQEEEALSPTAFIQSTHNTVAAQIALMLHCTGYNNTFVHRGFSFESALLDSVMLLQEGAAKTVLAGGLDEITDASHAILERFGLYRRSAGGSGATASETTGSGTTDSGATAPAANGEGATFFLLTSEPSGNEQAILEGLETFYKPVTKADVENKIDRFLFGHSLTREDVDLILTGTDYKHLCGEYPTASAFALALAAGLTHGAGTGSEKGRILLHTDYLNIHHSLMLVTKC